MFDYAAARETMLDSQIRTSDVTDKGIQAAFLRIPREIFVPKARIGLAYSDSHIDLGNGRHMLRPRDLAKMIEAVDIGPTDVVLDIACGRGYCAAILSELCETVVALEDTPQAAQKATALLERCDVSNVAVLSGDLKAGIAEHGPFDIIFVSGGSISEVPESWFDQMVNGGRLVAAITEGPLCRITVFTKSGDRVGERVVFDTGVPVLPGFEPKQKFVL